MRKFVTGAIVAAAATALLIAVYGQGRSSEPRYQGRSLSYWLSVPEQRDYPDDSKLSPAAREAIRVIGTNAIPTALRWISYEPSAATLTLIKLMQSIAPVIGTTWTAKGDHFAFQAENIFAILGSDARAAIPKLTRLTITSRTETRVWRCARALGQIGPEGTLGLVDVLDAQGCKARLVVAITISYLGSNAAPAIPCLLRCLADKEDSVACAASVILGGIGLSPVTVIPALTNALPATNAQRRAAVINGLAGFGAAAKSAAPYLQQALADPSEMVREQATNALLRIAPELLTNSAER